MAVSLTTVHPRTVGVEFTNATAISAKMVEHIYVDSHTFTRKVFDEDAGICRKVQAGLENATYLAVLAERLEDRVRHFQSAYVSSKQQLTERLQQNFS